MEFTIARGEQKEQAAAYSCTAPTVLRKIGKAARLHKERNKERSVVADVDQGGGSQRVEAPADDGEHAAHEDDAGDL